jgi:hypothetical protein
LSIDLEKQVKHAGIVLAKRNVTRIPTVRVGVANDVSGSTRLVHTQGIVQSVLSRLLALAINFDDDGELDTWVFDDKVTQLKPMTRENHEGYVERNILHNPQLDIWGSTSYAPALEAVLNAYFPESSSPSVESPKPSGFFKRLFGAERSVELRPVSQKRDSGIPAMCLFITDGDNGDKAEAESIIKTSQDYPVYWQLVGVGQDDFKFLQRMADRYPNTGFVNFSHLNLSDEALYDQLITDELAQWVKAR